MSPEERAAWLEQRTRYVTASEVAVLMGCSPYKTVREWALDKLFGEQEKDSKAMQRGRDREAPILARYAEHVGRPITANTALVVSEAAPWLAATPDGYDGKNTVEIKSVRLHARRSIHDVVSLYAYQVLCQIVCAGAEHGVLAVEYDQEKPLFIADFYSTDPRIGDMLEVTRRAWETVIRDGKMLGG